MTEFRQPLYLTPEDEPQLRVRCPIHGFIRYSRNERQVIDHSVYQRLRYIRQLGLTELLYPGATHSRFEHSLGVMQVATLAFDRLAARCGERLEATFAAVETTADRPLAKARQILRLAALLHDVGHACFSHAAESLIHKDIGGHETFARKMLLNEYGEGFGTFLDQLYFDGCAALVARVLHGPSGQLEPQLLVLHDIVNGEIDADRTDYLRRDAHHCGVDYGRFDHLRLLDTLELYEDGGRLEMAIHRDGIHALEALIIARYQMNTQVYYHRLRRLFDLYLRRYIEALGAEFFGTPERILRMTDPLMLAQIEEDATSGESERAKWARRIRNRNFHRQVFFTGDHADTLSAKWAIQLHKDLEANFEDVEFLLDKPEKPVTIHKFAKSGELDEGAPILYVIRSNGAVAVTTESRILQEIPKEFLGVRIFADVPGGPSNRRTEIEEYARKRWRELGGQ